MGRNPFGESMGRAHGDSMGSPWASMGSPWGGPWGKPVEPTGTKLAKRAPRTHVGQAMIEVLGRQPLSQTNRPVSR